MKKVTLYSLLCCLILTAASTVWSAVLPENYRIEPVMRNLTDPSAMAFAPDGRIFYLERTTGNVRIIDNGKLLPDPFVTVSVSTVGEEGLLGIAIYPETDFPAESFFDVCLYYTQASPHTNRIIRYTADGNVGVNETVILDNIGYAPLGTNNGGGLVIGNDGMLYATIGDMESPSDAQSDSSIKGKVLQIDLETPGFPYTIYSKGFRNPCGIAVNETTGTLYATDDYDSDATCDETNVVTSATNYGWDMETCAGGSYQDPLHNISPQKGVMGLTAYTGDEFPGFTDDLFIAGETNGDILRGETTTLTETYSDFYNAPSGETACPTTMKDVVEGEDGWLYAVSGDPDTGEAGIYRIIYDETTGNGAEPREVSASPHIQLSLSNDDGGGLRLWWEDLKRDAWGCTPPDHCPAGSKQEKYTVWEGTLGSWYSHSVLVETNGDGTEETDALVSYGIASMPSGNKYYLVSARAANYEGTTGYQGDWVTERPGHAQTDLCNAIGWGEQYDQCSNNWPDPVLDPPCSPDEPGYPDQNNKCWRMHDFRGKYVMLGLEQFD